MREGDTLSLSKGWKEVRLGELITTKKGYAFKSGWYENKGVPIVRVSDFTDNSISVENIFYINKELALDYSSVLLNTRDIIVQTVGSWQHNPASIVGKVVRVPSNLNNSLLNQNAVKLIANDMVVKDFLYYRLKDESFKFHNLNFAQGAANQASITLDTIKSFKINLPPLPTQQRIAEILSGYDDLIENNLKRIKILEEMAQQTYEEWFVRMRFPGHDASRASASGMESETGLPEGWEKVKLGEIADFKYGSMPKKENISDSGYPVFSGYRNTGFSNKYNVSKKSLIVVARGVGGTGDVKFTPQKCWLTNLSILLNLKNDEFINYLYYYLKAANLRSLDSGAAQSQITIVSLEPFPILIPDIQIIIKFNSLVEPMFKSIENLQNQNQRLREARDILLPRLMMGMIEV